MATDLRSDVHPIRPDAEPADARPLIRGRSVAYTGKLAAISHEQFVDIVQTFGGTYNNGVKLGIGTGLLVVGQGTLPIGRHGLPTHQLRQLRVLERRENARIKLLTEEQFLAGLGLQSQREQVRPLLTTSTLCQLLGVTRQRLGAWVKAGLIQPVTVSHGVWHFDFQQVSAAKTLTELARTGVPLGRVRRSLRQLSNWIPELRQPLAQLSVLEHGRDLVVRLESGEMVTADGQLHLEFDPTETDDHEPIRLHLETGPRTASQWYEQGLEQETVGYYEDAAESYRQALLLGGPDADVCFDLANALHQLGRRQQALERYHQVLEIDARRSDAWNNLGIVLSELDRPEEAIAAFRKALQINPEDTRAHYNLADALDEAGLPHEALPHWRAYAAADPFSRWGQYARSRVAEA